jgi:hypothetical protein
VMLDPELLLKLKAAGVTRRFSVLAWILPKSSHVSCVLIT